MSCAMTIRRSGLVLLGLAAVAFLGCSTSTQTALTLTDAQGNHAAGWVATHPPFARPDGSACVDCHGSVTDPAQSGGIAGVSCFSASRNGQSCHATGPALHPANWLDKGGSSFHGTAFLLNTTIRGNACLDCHAQGTPLFICLNCHFTVNGGRVPPGANFVHGQILGHTQFFGSAVAPVCERCHETNNTFGHMPQPFCHNCHAPFPAGVHPAGWATPEEHGAKAKLAPTAGQFAGFSNCQGQPCHGVNLTGPDAPTCIGNTACHGFSNDNAAAGIANPAPHPPRPWNVRFAPTRRTHTTTVPDDRTAGVCDLCHRNAALLQTTQPPAVFPPLTTPAGCFNGTLCHAQVGAPHPVRPFPDHPARARAEFDTFCVQCHNIDPPRRLTAAPVCTECHRGGNPFTFLNCASCHASPPNGGAPVGAVFPNVPGAHAKHTVLNGVGTVCNVCHNTGGTGTGLNHFYDNQVRVAFRDLAFKAKLGNLGFNAADNTCANVSCHGGQVTPNWRQAGAINVNTDCARCHRRRADSDQFNSYFSGRHDLHNLNEFPGRFTPTCIGCHDDARLAPGHFTNLATAQVFEQLPASTIRAPLQYNGTSCNPAAGGLTGCHGEKDW